ncbi:Kinesin-like protein KIN-12C [Linum perenne]
MTSQAPSRHSTSNLPDEAKENEFESSFVPAQFPPPRTPLHTIPDPAQYHSHACEELKSIESPRFNRFADKNIDIFDKSVSANATPKGFSRPSKSHSEPSSAHSTPARIGPRVSLGPCTVAPRSSQITKGKELGSYSSRVSRGISIPDNDVSPAVPPRFELRIDPSFWADHNVQVLIRIRPLNATEKVSQGYRQCLKQESANSIVWLGNPETRFTFDNIASETVTQEELFRVAGLPMVDNCMSGYNSCMFAYGQTGSGKTYTMMGEISHAEGQLGENCGMANRIFEYLFLRIRMEEENRRDEKLMFHCKCSFLEIYNEQITDLLEPSATNLQLREDLSKGVYVENLTEHNVRTVNDVVMLLLQGAANRKSAATHMNSESSRSHSVFTCIIESCWEKDSLKHFRFARLNLVDLAGSERQKSSGAEGDRLREAANINKSLSTLGLVIMSLVDLAHGKNRHVPYRDSRLTFLLQDSLGGNSKTMVVANVSPSMCAAHETLSTLKFAQRAKLIQNNAMVNEDATGDVGALQRQIKQLKEQLSVVMKDHKPPRSLMTNKESQFSDCCGIDDSSEEKKSMDDISMLNSESQKLGCMETIMVGALRREKMAETALQQLQAEVKQVIQLAHQKEEDVHHTRTMLRLREEKIRHLELLVDGSLPAEHYLREENKALKEEIQLLNAGVDNSPKVTSLVLENTRLHEQIQLFQKFYEQGERETILAEMSVLRDQMVEMLERKPGVLLNKDKQSLKENGSLKELEHCKNMNSRLMREVDDLHVELNKIFCCSQSASDTEASSLFKDTVEIRHSDKYSLVETISYGNESEDEVASLRPDNLGHQRRNYGSKSPRFVIQHDYAESENMDIQKKGPTSKGDDDYKSITLQVNLEKLRENLKDVVSANCRYQEDQASQLSKQQHVELISEQVEIETARTIINLQTEVDALQSEFSERFSCLTEENIRLENALAAKEDEIRAVNEEWELSTLELTNFLVKGSKSLKDASGQVETIAHSFPQVNEWISEHVERAARICIEKDETILQLQRSLEDAQKMVVDMELKLNSLKEATLVFKDFPKADGERIEEVIDLKSVLNVRMHPVEMQEDRLACSLGDNKEEHKTSIQGNVIASCPSKLCSLENVDAGFNNDKVGPFSAFLRKCEEARTTMEDADYMLTILLKANENERQLNCVVKQANGEVMLDGSQVTAENGQLKISVPMKENENELLLGEACQGLSEVSSSMSLLEGCFQEMHTQVQHEYEAIHLSFLSMGKEILHSIRHLRSSMKGTCSEVTGKEFVLCTLNPLIQQDTVDNIQLQQQKLTGSPQDACASNQYNMHFTSENGTSEGHGGISVTNLNNEGLGSPKTLLTFENLSLRKELERKEVLLRGLLFDFRLLQETASRRKDKKDETENLVLTLSEVRQHLEMKTSEFDNLLVQYKKIESHMVDLEEALMIANSDLEQAKDTIENLSDNNAELRMILKDLYLSKSEAEERLAEEKEVVKGLEEEILHLTSSTESRLCYEGLQEDLRKMTCERDHLREEINSLNDKLEVAYGLADENEAIAVEARQELEEQNVYCQQKEEEVKILEHSIGELESTINVLEQKVHEMDKEVERHRFIRESLELELQTLRQRLSAVETFADCVDSEQRGTCLNGDTTTRQLKSRLVQLHEALNRISLLEKQNAEKAKEIKQLKEYISEVELHSDAQASHYQDKYKNLEAMVREFEANLPSSASAFPSSERSEKCPRARGSSSPFRCISGLVQQMNSEKEQELSAARLRIEELEALLASQQKEVCMLNTRLAAAESMTHDVIRDLLGVKLDITNYANLIEENQVQKLVEEAHHQKKDFHAKEQEILQLREQINNLIEEIESCKSEMHSKAAELLSAQITAEQLEERDQLLSAQYEMLKMDKTNLLRRVSELDDMVKTLLGTQNSQHRTSRTAKPGDAGFKQRIVPHSENLSSRWQVQRGHYRRLSVGSNPNGRGLELKHKQESEGKSKLPRLPLY